MTSVNNRLISSFLFMSQHFILQTPEQKSATKKAFKYYLVISIVKFFDEITDMIIEKISNNRKDFSLIYLATHSENCINGLPSQYFCRFGGCVIQCLFRLFQTIVNLIQCFPYVFCYLRIFWNIRSAMSDAYHVN